MQLKSHQSFPCDLHYNPLAFSQPLLLPVSPHVNLWPSSLTWSRHMVLCLRHVIVLWCYEQRKFSEDIRNWMFLFHPFLCFSDFSLRCASVFISPYPFNLSRQEKDCSSTFSSPSFVSSCLKYVQKPQMTRPVAPSDPTLFHILPHFIVLYLFFCVCAPMKQSQSVRPEHKQTCRCLSPFSLMKT